MIKRSGPKLILPHSQAQQTSVWCGILDIDCISFVRSYKLHKNLTGSTTLTCGYLHQQGSRKGFSNSHVEGHTFSVPVTFQPSNCVGEEMPILDSFLEPGEPIHRVVAPSQTAQRASPPSWRSLQPSWTPCFLEFSLKILLSKIFSLPLSSAFYLPSSTSGLISHR